MRHLWILLVASGLYAQSPQDSAHARTQKIAIDSINGSVIPATNKYCKTQNAVGYMKAACPILVRQTRALVVAESMLVVSTTPPDTTHPLPIDTTFHVFAQNDFSSGSLAPFWNPYASVQPPVVVIPDPIATGHGNVIQFHYENWPEGGNYDANIAIETDQNDPNTHATNGDEVIFEGDFYLPKGPLTDTLNLYGLRKLNYWCSAAGPSHACLVLTTQPNWPAGVPLPAGMAVPNQQLMLSIGYGTGGDWPYYGIDVLSNQWHHLVMDMKLNSSNAVKDGKMKIIYDGQVVTDRSDMQFVDPASTAPIDWYDWRIGEQINSGHKIAEDRYWDNLKFSIKRAPTSRTLTASRRQRLVVPQLKFPAHEPAERLRASHKVKSQISVPVKKP